MAGTGQGAKHPATRQRRNVKSSRAVLQRDPNAKSPRIPPHPSGKPFHPQALQYWHQLWHSPMAQEYDPATDSHGIWMLVVSYDDYLTAPTPIARQKAAVEVRLQGVRYGITPWDRRRLEWQIEKTEEEKDRGTKRRAAQGQGTPGPAAAEPDGEADEGHDVDGFLRAV